MFYYPGNIGNLSCSLSAILEILENEVSILPRILDIFQTEVSIIPRILEMREAGGRAAGERLQGLCCAALVIF